MGNENLEHFMDENTKLKNKMKQLKTSDADSDSSDGESLIDINDNFFEKEFLGLRKEMGEIKELLKKSCVGSSSLSAPQNPLNNAPAEPPTNVSKSTTDSGKNISEHVETTSSLLWYSPQTIQY